ncbi:Phosphocarrier protein HPr [Borrelia miyamotoi FR64b]|nr:Phosphocarrier protein HPr [Borrelia miyamotoi FR64b]
MVCAEGDDEEKAVAELVELLESFKE